jgi:ribosome modulation factor
VDHNVLWGDGISCDTHVLFRSRPAKLFRAGRVCWIPDGPPCVAVSWLAGGRVWWTWKGSSCAAVSGLAGWRQSLVALKRVVVRSGWLAGWRQSLVALMWVGVFLLSFSRAAGWTPGGGDGGDL